MIGTQQLYKPYITHSLAFEVIKMGVKNWQVYEVHHDGSITIRVYTDSKAKANWHAKRLLDRATA